MIFSQSSRAWNLEIRRLRFSSVSWILRSMLMGQRIYKNYLKEPNIYYITSLDVLIPLAGLTSWAPYSRGFDLMFCCCPLEILNFWKWGVCFHFALSPTNFVAVLPVRWVIHRNRKSQSTALEVGVLTLLGELQPTQLQCRARGCKSLSQNDAIKHLFYLTNALPPISFSPSNLLIMIWLLWSSWREKAGWSCWLPTWFRKLLTKLAFWWHASVSFLMGSCPWDTGPLLLDYWDRRLTSRHRAVEFTKVV